MRSTGRTAVTRGGDPVGRKATGTVRILLNQETGWRQWHAKWTRADGTRTEWLPIDPNIPLSDEEGAKACAARMAPKVWRASAIATGVETCDQYFDRLSKTRESEGIKSVRKER
jgi:hypothetical protein